MFGRKNSQTERAKVAEKKRDEALEELEESRKTLMAARQEAEDSVSACLNLLGSMRSMPFKIKKRMGSIEHERKRFRKSDELVERQFARDSIITGAAVVAVGGVLGAVYKFHDEIANLLKKKPPLVIAGILGAVAGVTLFVGAIGLFFIRKNAKEWSEFTEECLRAGEEARKASLKAKRAAIEISRQTEGLKRHLESLAGLHGKKFRSLSDSAQDRLWQLLLNAETLAREINAEVVA